MKSATPTEHKTVQARILKYAQEIGWRFVPRAEAEVRRGFDANGATAEERARMASLFFGDLLYEQTRAFNPKYAPGDVLIFVIIIFSDNPAWVILMTESLFVICYWAASIPGNSSNNTANKTVRMSISLKTNLFT